jgi:hypothetical protein
VLHSADVAGQYVTALPILRAARQPSASQPRGNCCRCAAHARGTGRAQALTWAESRRRCGESRREKRRLQQQRNVPRGSTHGSCSRSWRCTCSPCAPPYPAHPIGGLGTPWCTFHPALARAQPSPPTAPGRAQRRHESLPLDLASIDDFGSQPRTHVRRTSPDGAAAMQGRQERPLLRGQWHGPCEHGEARAVKVQRRAVPSSEQL